MADGNDTDELAAACAPAPLPGVLAVVARAVAVTVAFVLTQTVIALVALAAFELAGVDVPKRLTGQGNGDLAFELVSEVTLGTVWVAVAARRARGRGAASIFGPLHAAARSMRAAMPVVVITVLVPVLASGGLHPARNATVGRALLLVALAWTVAVAEEVIFRGVLLDVAGGAARPVFATVLAALLFGIVHLANAGSLGALAVNAIGVTLLVGVPFACIRLRTDSLAGPIVAHGVIDSYALLTLNGTNLKSPGQWPSIALQSSYGLVVAAAYLWWLRRPRSDLSTGPPDPHLPKR
jgi:membrane protease YdiL (CAAX protease family)